MTKENIKSKKGFTIIEVVLVLAIAGLIFLMVFVALPALQRSQRDTQRRDDMARFMSQLSQYQANNNGKVPTLAVGTDTTDGYTKFMKDYLEAGGDTFNDPSTGSRYVIEDVFKCANATDCVNKTTTSTEMGKVYVYSNATCDGESVKYVQGDRKIAITLNLEGAGIYCGHN